jgi:hypothetical protein
MSQSRDDAEPTINGGFFVLDKHGSRVGLVMTDSRRDSQPWFREQYSTCTYCMYQVHLLRTSMCYQSCWVQHGGSTAQLCLHAMSSHRARGRTDSSLVAFL